MFYLCLLVAGGVGAVLRYLLGRFAINMGWTAIPFGTLLANVIGSFLMGYFAWWLVQNAQASSATQSVVLTGFLGGFTTFSAFSYETVAMLYAGESVKALFYMLASLTVCVSACFLGLLLAKHT